MGCSGCASGHHSGSDKAHGDRHQRDQQNSHRADWILKLRIGERVSMGTRAKFALPQRPALFLIRNLDCADLQSIRHHRHTEIYTQFAHVCVACVCVRAWVGGGGLVHFRADACAGHAQHHTCSASVLAAGMCTANRARARLHQKCLHAQQSNMPVARSPHSHAAPEDINCRRTVPVKCLPLLAWKPAICTCPENGP